jgi:hypothetical protein
MNVTICSHMHAPSAFHNHRAPTSQLQARIPLIRRSIYSLLAALPAVLQFTPNAGEASTARYTRFLTRVVSLLTQTRQAGSYSQYTAQAPRFFVCTRAGEKSQRVEHRKNKRVTNLVYPVASVQVWASKSPACINGEKHAGMSSTHDR